MTSFFRPSINIKENINIELLKHQPSGAIILFERAKSFYVFRIRKEEAHMNEDFQNNDILRQNKAEGLITGHRSFSLNMNMFFLDGR